MTLYFVSISVRNRLIFVQGTCFMSTVRWLEKILNFDRSTETIFDFWNVWMYEFRERKIESCFRAAKYIQYFITSSSSNNFFFLTYLQACYVYHQHLSKHQIHIAPQDDLREWFSPAIRFLRVQKPIQKIKITHAWYQRLFIAMNNILTS